MNMPTFKLSLIPKVIKIYIQNRENQKCGELIQKFTRN